MFGLMKNGGCADIDARHYRLHYCGTCKAIGSRYGQLSRLSLNYDVVFLSELLSDLMGERPTDWGPALQAYACYRQPRQTEALPHSLEIAAAVNVLLAGIKLKDQAQDTGHRRWRWAQRLFSPTYQRALRHLRRLGLDEGLVTQTLRAQQALERQPWPAEMPPLARLHRLAEPTARLTGEMFGLAFRATDAGLAAAMTQAGQAFGRLVFWLDAWTDRQEDAAQGQFNALFAAYDGAEGLAAATAEVTTWLEGQAEAVASSLEALPLPAARRAYYQAKLRLNVAAALHPQAACRPLPTALRAEMGRATLPGLGRRLGMPIRWAQDFLPAGERRLALTTFGLGFLLLGGTHLLGAAAAPAATPDLGWLWASAAGAGSLTGAVAAGRWLDRKARRGCDPGDPPKKGWLRRFFSKKRPWWHWLFIGLGIISGAFLALIVLALLLLLVALVFSGDCGGCDCGGDCGSDCCGGCDCGDCDCGGCDCSCN